MGYFKDVVSGVSWMGGLRGLTRILALLKIAVLARLLTPFQFGLFGIASLALAFLETLTETGINVFFIQGEGKLKDYINTAWVVSALRGVLISLLILLSANIIALFFNSPESRNLLYLIALVPFVRGFINPSIVKFRMNLLFKSEFLLRSVIYGVEAATTLVFAILTRNASSFVWGMIIGAVTEVMLSFILFKPKPKLIFSMEKAKKVISRGKWVAVAQTADLGFEHTDDVLVGRLLDATSLGIYQVAYKISTLPLTEVGKVVSQVTFPVYAKIGGDLNRLNKAFVKVFLSVCVMAIPAGLLLYLFPKQIVLVTLGEKWLSAVIVLKVLAIFGIMRALVHTTYSLFLTVKKQEYIAYLNIISFVGLAITVIPLIKYYGILGAAYSAIIGLFISIPFAYYYVLKVLRASSKNGRQYS